MFYLNVLLIEIFQEDIGKNNSLFNSNFVFFVFSEDQIINHYKACREIVRGLCIVK